MVCIRPTVPRRRLHTFLRFATVLMIGFEVLNMSLTLSWGILPDSGFPITSGMDATLKAFLTIAVVYYVFHTFYSWYLQGRSATILMLIDALMIIAMIPTLILWWIDGAFWHPSVPQLLARTALSLWRIFAYSRSRIGSGQQEKILGNQSVLGTEQFRLIWVCRCSSPPPLQKTRPGACRRPRHSAGHMPHSGSALYPLARSATA